MNHVEAERLRDQAIDLVWSIDKMLMSIPIDLDDREYLQRLERLHRISVRTFRRFMRRSALVRKLQNIETGEIR